MELVIHDRDDDITHVSLAGRLDATEVHQIETRLADATAQPRPTIVELAGLEFLSSLGIGLLFASTKRLKQAGCKLVLLNPKGMVEEVLRSSRMDKVMPIAHGLDEALRILRGGDRGQTGAAARPAGVTTEDAAPGRPQPALASFDGVDSVDDVLKLSIRNELSELKNLYAAVGQFLQKHSIAYKPGYAINLAIEELIVNVIRYAYVDDHTHQIGIELRLTNDQVILRIEDDGRPFDPRESPALTRDLEEPEAGGLGLVLVLDIVDVLKYARVEDKNRVEVRVHLGAMTDGDEAGSVTAALTPS